MRLMHIKGRRKVMLFQLTEEKCKRLWCSSGASRALREDIKKEMLVGCFSVLTISTVLESHRSGISKASERRRLEFISLFKTVRLIPPSFTAESGRMTVTLGSNETVNGTNAINPIRLLVLPMDESSLSLKCLWKWFVIRESTEFTDFWL